MFSFSLICESITAQFLTFVLHKEQTLDHEEKDSPSSATTKSSVFSRSANFLNFSPFLVGATNIFSELIHPLLKLPNCVLEQQPHILQLSEALVSFGFLPLQEATGFVGVVPLPLIFDPPLYILHFTIYRPYISQRNNTKICFRNYWIQRQDSKASAHNNTCYSPAKSVSECIKFTKRVEL